MEPVGIFMGICIDLLKRKKKTKYHAKIEFFLIDSEQKKYLELIISPDIGGFYEICIFISFPE
jgi:hypothetical protein